MTKDELKLALKHAKRDERHLSNVETRYWCDQYKLLATQAIEALAQPEQKPMHPQLKAMFEDYFDKCFAESKPQQPKCNPHPKAPHGFNRNASHSADRYVCECEGWDAYEAGRQDGVEAMLKYDNPQFKLGKQLTTSEIIDCAVAVWRYDANDVSENTIKFGIEVQKRVLDRQK